MVIIFRHNWVEYAKYCISYLVISLFGPVCVSIWLAGGSMGESCSLSICGCRCVELPWPSVLLKVGASLCMGLWAPLACCLLPLLYLVISAFRFLSCRGVLRTSWHMMSCSYCWWPRYCLMACLNRYSNPASNVCLLGLRSWRRMNIMVVTWRQLSTACNV